MGGEGTEEIKARSLFTCVCVGSVDVHNGTEGRGGRKVAAEKDYNTREDKFIHRFRQKRGVPFLHFLINRKRSDF